jgi:hypothetical protein
VITNGDRRLEEFKKEAGRQGFQYVVSPAVFRESKSQGISEAHRAVVNQAKLAGLDECCIMEDDVVFFKPDSFRIFLKKKPRRFDLYLGGIISGSVDRSGRVPQFSGLHCYIISSRFYDTFLSADPYNHIDRWLSDRGEFFVCVPQVCTQRQFFRNI